MKCSIRWTFINDESSESEEVENPRISVRDLTVTRSGWLSTLYLVGPSPISSVSRSLWLSLESRSVLKSLMSSITMSCSVLKSLYDVNRWSSSNGSP